VLKHQATTTERAEDQVSDSGDAMVGQPDDTEPQTMWKPSQMGMSWLLIGGFAGGAVFGPLGAVVGMPIGMAIGEAIERKYPTKPRPPTKNARTHV
jgi:hypothetical protein